MSEMIDWDIGQYEQMAVELEPVAEHMVSLAHLQPGERVVDLATGTGNAALLAAGAGAFVTGLDTAPRLIDLARDRAVARVSTPRSWSGTCRRCRSTTARSTSLCRCSD